MLAGGLHGLVSLHSHGKQLQIFEGQEQIDYLFTGLRHFSGGSKRMGTGSEIDAGALA